MEIISKKQQKELQKEIREEYNRHFSNITFLLFLAYFWETLEHYVEDLPYAWSQSIFGGQHEFWANRLIGDGVCIVIGYLIAFQFREHKFFGFAFLALWLGIAGFGFWLGPTVEGFYSNELAPLWGQRDKSVFDFWSLIHVFSGTVIGSFVIWWNKEIPEALEKKI